MPRLGGIAIAGGLALILSWGCRTNAPDGPVPVVARHERERAAARLRGFWRMNRRLTAHNIFQASGRDFGRLAPARQKAFLKDIDFFFSFRFAKNGRFLGVFRVRKTEKSGVGRYSVEGKKAGPHLVRVRFADNGRRETLDFRLEFAAANRIRVSFSDNPELKFVLERPGAMPKSWRKKTVFRGLVFARRGKTIVVRAFKTDGARPGKTMAFLDSRGSIAARGTVVRVYHTKVLVRPFSGSVRRGYRAVIFSGDN